MDAAIPNRSSLTQFDDLPEGIQKAIFECLPGNEVVCNVRLTNKAANAMFRDKVDIHLSESVPAHIFNLQWGVPNAANSLDLHQRQKLMVLTARSGHLANLQLALATAGCAITDKVLEAAAGRGHLQACELLLAVNCPRSAKAAAAAVRGGHLAVVRLLLQQEQGDPSALQSFGCCAWEAAAGAGNRALCEALEADGVPVDWKAPAAAAKAGHVGLTVWLLKLQALRRPAPSSWRGIVFEDRLLAGAAYGFDLAGLQHLYQTLQAHAERRNLSVALGRHPLFYALASPTPDWKDKVLWLLERGYRFATLYSDDDEEDYLDLKELARRPDAVERVELLWEKVASTEYREEEEADIHFALHAENAMLVLIDAAVEEGNLALLRNILNAEPGLRSFIYESLQPAFPGVSTVFVAEALAALGLRVESDFVCAAARGGHLHLLQWLAAPEAGVPVMGLGPEGRVEALPAHGPAGGQQALQCALGRPYLAWSCVESGRLELLEWALERGCALNEWVFAAAARAGNMVALEALAARGCPMGCSGMAYVWAGEQGDMLTLRCLRRLGCPWDPDGGTFTQAVHNDGNQAGYDARRPTTCSLEVLHWLLEEGCPVDWPAAWRQAQRRRDLVDPSVRHWIRGRLPLGQLDDQ